MKKLLLIFLIGVLGFVFYPKFKYIFARFNFENQTQILIATKDLQAGEDVHPDNAALQPWPAKSLSEQMIVEGKHQEVYDTPINAFVPKGMPLYYANFSPVKSQAALALQEGMEAFTFSLKSVRNPRINIVPGAHISVYAGESRGSDSTYTLIIPNVRVLAVERQFKKTSGVNLFTEQKKIISRLTLELTPEQTLKMLAFIENAKIFLSVSSEKTSFKLATPSEKLSFSIKTKENYAVANADPGEQKPLIVRRGGQDDEMEKGLGKITGALKGVI